MDSSKFTNETFKFMTLIPDEVRKIIFYFIPVDSYMKDETKLIKNIIRVYNVDHDYDLTKMYKLYFMKSFMSFYVYVFNTLEYDEDGYDGPLYGRRFYDTLELDPCVRYDKYFEN